MERIKNWQFMSDDEGSKANWKDSRIEVERAL
jgi:hypothetical protein